MYAGRTVLILRRSCGCQSLWRLPSTTYQEGIVGDGVQNGADEIGTYINHCPNLHYITLLKTFVPAFLHGINNERCAWLKIK